VPLDADVNVLLTLSPGFRTPGDIILKTAAVTQMGPQIITVIIQPRLLYDK